MAEEPESRTVVKSWWQDIWRNGVVALLLPAKSYPYDPVIVPGSVIASWKEELRWGGVGALIYPAGSYPFVVRAPTVWTPPPILDGRGQPLASRVPGQTTLDRLVYMFQTYERAIDVRITSEPYHNNVSRSVCIEDNPAAADDTLMSCVRMFMDSVDGRVHVCITKELDFLVVRGRAMKMDRPCPSRWR